MTLRVLNEAEQDIVEAARWYQSISPELATRFLTEWATAWPPSNVTRGDTARRQTIVGPQTFAVTS